MRAVLTVVLMSMSMTAYAGKEEREFMKNDVTPALKAAEGAFKKACGCALSISVDDKTLKSVDELRQAKYVAESIKDGAAGHCTDKESKAAVCKMKKLTVKKGKEAAFTFARDAGTSETD